MKKYILITEKSQLLLSRSPDRATRCRLAGQRKPNHTVAVIRDSTMTSKEQEKIQKYQNLKLKQQKPWKDKVEIIPIVIWTLGAIPKNFKKNLESVIVDLSVGLMQESVLFNATRIPPCVLNM